MSNLTRVTSSSTLAVLNERDLLQAWGVFTGLTLPNWVMGGRGERHRDRTEAKRDREGEREREHE